MLITPILMQRVDAKERKVIFEHGIISLVLSQSNLHVSVA